MSLSRHLTSSAGEHGRLGFHPDCPRCCADRLAGDLGGDTLVSRRTQAALAAGVLAFSAAGPPAAAMAQEPDQQQEGVSDPEAEAPEMSPDFDPGGDNTFDGDTGSVPDAPGSGGENDEGDGLPVDEEPPVGVVPHIVPEPEPEAPQPVPAPEPLPSTPVPPAAPAPVSPPAPPAEAPEPPARAAKPKKQAVWPRDRVDKPERAIAAPAPAPGAAPVTAPVSPAPPPSLPAAPAVVETVRVSQAAGPPPALVEGKRYTVRPGDSLWSIARRQLGPDASTGRLARRVNRLWELNADRIGTGSPSLLHVGTVLRLP